MNFKTKIIQYSKSTWHRYLIVGGSVYVLEMIIIIIAQKLGASAVLSVGIAFWVGFIASFTLTKFVTFADKRSKPKVLVSQLTAYSLLVLFNFGFAIGLAHLFVNLLPAVVNRTISIAITTIWNYFLYKKHIFTQYTEIM